MPLTASVSRACVVCQPLQEHDVFQLGTEHSIPNRKHKSHSHSTDKETEAQKAKAMSYFEYGILTLEYGIL